MSFDYSLRVDVVCSGGGEGGREGGGRGVKRRGPEDPGDDGPGGDDGGCGAADSPSCLADSLKRVRLGRCAGELRLGQDIRDCGDLVTAGLLQLELLATNIVLAHVRGAAVRTFHVHVSKRYPHEPPAVYAAAARARAS